MFNTSSRGRLAAILVIISVLLPLLVRAITGPEAAAGGMKLSREKRLLSQLSHYKEPSNCGTRFVSQSSRSQQLVRHKRMLNSSDTYWGEFPFYVQVIGNNSDPCAGALLTNQIMIMPVWCTMTNVSDYFNQTRMRLYYFSLNTRKNFRSVKSGTDIRVGMACSANTTFEVLNNYVIIILNKELLSDENNRVVPICLPKDPLESLEDTDLTVVGFGANQQEEGNVKYPAVLQQLKVNPVAHNKTRKVMMVRPTEGQARVCRGDNGNPIINIENGRMVLRGLVYFNETRLVDSCAQMPNGLIYGINMFRFKSDIIWYINRCVDSYNAQPVKLPEAVVHRP